MRILFDLFIYMLLLLTWLWVSFGFYVQSINFNFNSATILFCQVLVCKYFYVYYDFFECTFTFTIDWLNRMKFTKKY